MKTIAASLFLALIVVSAAFGQAEIEKRVIEVSGSAETLITPDEFTFKVTILERMEKKEKLTIETQEAALRSELSRIGLIPRKTFRCMTSVRDTFLKKKCVMYSAARITALRFVTFQRSLPLSSLSIV